MYKVHNVYKIISTFIIPTWIRSILTSFIRFIPNSCSRTFPTPCIRFILKSCIRSILKSCIRSINKSCIRSILQVCTTCISFSTENVYIYILTTIGRAKISSTTTRTFRHLLLCFCRVYILNVLFIKLTTENEFKWNKWFSLLMLLSVYNKTNCVHTPIMSSTMKSIPSKSILYFTSVAWPI